jgi:mRNA-degrading endonuclease HigB of HigAB toxin-antitoxin module
MLYSGDVRIIALATLKAFLNRSTAYAEARDPVMAWYRQVKAADWATPADIKRDVRSASSRTAAWYSILPAISIALWCGSTTHIALSI